MSKEKKVESLSNFQIRDVPESPEVTLFDKEHFAKVDAMSDEEFLSKWNVRRAKLGLPPMTLEEFLA